MNDKTTPNDEVLSEFVAGLLKCEFWPDGIWWILPKAVCGRNKINCEDLVYVLFESDCSPIFRHLIEEAMEERGYRYLKTIPEGIEKHSCQFRKKDEIDYTGWVGIPAGIDNNKTRAVALAAYRALEGVVG